MRWKQEANVEASDARGADNQNHQRHVKLSKRIQRQRLINVFVIFDTAQDKWSLRHVYFNFL